MSPSWFGVTFTLFVTLALTHKHIVLRVVAEEPHLSCYGGAACIKREFVCFVALTPRASREREKWGNKFSFFEIFVDYGRLQRRHEARTPGDATRSPPHETRNAV